jgi:hypothetical protein
VAVIITTALNCLNISVVQRHLLSGNTRVTCKSIQDRQCAYKRIIKAHSRNNYCRENAISVTYSKCVFVAFVIQHAMRVRRIISSVASLAVPLFSTLSHKRPDFRENVIEHKIRVLILSTTFVKKISF